MSGNGKKARRGRPLIGKRRHVSLNDEYWRELYEIGREVAGGLGNGGPSLAVRWLISEHIKRKA
jgi:hypothetical protein